MRIRLVDAVKRSPEELPMVTRPPQTYAAHGVIRRPRRSWVAEFARFEQLKPDSDASGAYVGDRQDSKRNLE
jgi:hypothetical protein